MIRLKQVQSSHNHNLLISQGILNMAGGLLSAVFSWGHFKSPLYELALFLCIASGALTILAVIVRKNSWSDRTSSLIFGANLIPVCGMIWASQAASASLGQYWVPFQANELSCLTIAILAPPKRRIGVFAILMFPVLALLQYMNFSPEQIALIPTRPLMAPIAFGAFALILYLFRLRELSIADFAAKKDAETQMMKKMTRTLLAIKDLANSPIQALTLDAETLKLKHAAATEIASRIEKSALQLRDLNRILDEQLRESMKSSAQISFNPHEELESTPSD